MCLTPLAPLALARPVGDHVPEGRRHRTGIATSEKTMTSDTRSADGVPHDDPTEPSEPSVPAEVMEEIVKVREEVGQLKEAVTSHATVDQAIGMMVALGRVTPDEGWAVLREVSQLTNIK